MSSSTSIDQEQVPGLSEERSAAQRSVTGQRRGVFSDSSLLAEPERVEISDEVLDALLAGASTAARTDSPQSAARRTRRSSWRGLTTVPR